MLTPHELVENHQVVCPEDDAPPVVALATGEQIGLQFPLTMFHQPELAAMVEQVERHDGALAADDTAEQARAAAEIEQLSANLRDVTCGLRNIVMRATKALGYDANVVDMTARVKSARRSAEKAALNAHDGHFGPMTDMSGVALVIHGVEPGQFVEQLRVYLGLPEQYPGDMPSVKVGGRDPNKPRQNVDSHDAYSDLKLIVPLMHEDGLRLGEVKVLTPEQAEIDRATRETYKSKRSHRFRTLVGRIALSGFFLV